MTINSKFNQGDFGNALAGADNRVTLPFGHLRLNWHNGNPQAEKKGAKHFGGWYSSDDKPDFLSDLSAINQEVAPSGFVGPEIWVNRESKEYTAYSARRVFAAPIATKVFWYFNSKTNKNSSITSILVYLADWSDERKAILPYAPGVLTAGGFVGNFMVDAFKKWQQETLSIRQEVAKGVPANMFYVPVGTFGKERITKLVGKGNAQSPVVPPQVGTPTDGWTAAEIERYFVGDDIGDMMRDLLRQAQEWLNEKEQKPAPGPIAPNASLDALNAALGNTNGDDDYPF